MQYKTVFKKGKDTCINKFNPLYLLKANFI